MRHGAQLLQGTLELMILKTLSWEPMNGYSISQWIKSQTRDEILIEEGALYPALHRLEGRDLVTAEWGISENNRRAKYYELTKAGKAELREQERNWARYTQAVGRVLQPRAGS